MRKSIKWIAFLSLGLSLTLAGIPITQPAAQAFAAGDVQYGSRGSNVTELESRLKYLGYYHGKIDGIFGWETYWAVRRFQYRFGMKIDGLAGAHTKAMLVKATRNWPGVKQTSGSTGSAHTPAHGADHQQSGTHSGAAKTSAPSTSTNRFHSAPVVSGLSHHDLNLMAHLVHGEARGEPFKGQVAVADVVLHRVKSSKYPNTVPGVIYQPGAFTAATNGQMNLPPNKESMKAVLDAVHGMDPSHGALNYFNPAKTNNAYAWSRPQIIKIGHHIFTK